LKSVYFGAQFFCVGIKVANLKLSGASEQLKDNSPGPFYNGLCAAGIAIFTKAF
jgi:hypothetical protein